MKTLSSCGRRETWHPGSRRRTSAVPVPAEFGKRGESGELGGGGGELFTPDLRRDALHYDTSSSLYPSTPSQVEQANVMLSGIAGKFENKLYLTT